MNLGRMLVLKKVRQWNREKMQNGRRDTAVRDIMPVGPTVHGLGNDPDGVSENSTLKRETHQ
jgi:hypothetical protein